MIFMCILFLHNVYSCFKKNFNFFHFENVDDQINTICMRSYICTCPISGDDIGNKKHLKQ